MLSMIGKRLMFAIPSLIGVVIVTFLLTRALPGDPAAYFAGPAANKEAIEQIRKKLGFDKPLIEQFFHYPVDLPHGDFGNSLTPGQPVATEIRNRLPASAELTLLGLVVSIVIAIPLGILAATKPGSWIDHLCRGATTAGVSLPVFFTGLVLVYVFYFLLGWSPAPLGRLDVFYSAPPTVTGFYLIDTLIARDLEAFRSALSQLILPATTLAVFSLAPIARMTRASMLAVLSSDFVRTARASGLSPGTVIVTYAFRNAMLPVITTLSMVFSFLLGANVLVEKVFAWPGIGSYAVEALISSDFAPVQGFVLTMAVMYVMLNLMIDILYGVIDPRVRLEGGVQHEQRCPRRRARRSRANLGVIRDVRAHPLCARRKPRHRVCIRPADRDRAGGAVRPLHRSPRSAGLRHRGRAEAAVGGALVRHRPARPRHFQPRHRGDTARYLHRGGLGCAGVPDGRACRHRRRLFRRLDRSHCRPHRRYRHGVSAVRAGDGHRGGARQHRAEHHHRDGDREFPALRPRRPRRAQCAARRRFRAGGAIVGQRRIPDSAGAYPAQHHADHDRADVADHGLRHPQRRRPVLHRARGADADRRMGNHGRGRRRLHGVGRMVDRAVSRRRTDDRGVLLQPARRRVARHRRPAAEDVRMSRVTELDASFHLAPLAGRGLRA